MNFVKGNFSKGFNFHFLDFDSYVLNCYADLWKEDYNILSDCNIGYCVGAY